MCLSGVKTVGYRTALYMNRRAYESRTAAATVRVEEPQMAYAGLAVVASTAARVATRVHDAMTVFTSM